MFSAKLENVNKSIDGLAAEMAGMQKQLAARQPVAFDPEGLAADLKKAGVEGKSIVVVPFDANMWALPK